MSDAVKTELEVRKRIPSSEKIKAVVEGLGEAVQPIGYRKKEKGGYQSVEARSPDEILERTEQNKSLLPTDVFVYISKTDEEIIQLEKLPETVKFSIESGVPGQDKRREQLREILGKIGIKEIQIKGEKFTTDEIWEAVVDVDGKGAAKDERSQKILNNIGEIREAVNPKSRMDILYLAAGLAYEKVDPLSLTTQQLRQPQSDAEFKLHEKQKPPNKAEVEVRKTLLEKKRLERWQVVNVFLNQRAEGRVGQKEAPKPGERQLPYQISYSEANKEMQIAGMTQEEVQHFVVRVLQETDNMVGSAQDELLEGIQGYGAWTAEVVIRRAHEIWSETSKSIQKDIGGMMTHLSEVGHGHFIAAALEIPEVGKILARPDWYQQRDPLTDRPKEMPKVTDVVKNVKKWAKDERIPSSKVDLAFFLTQLLQIGHWIGLVGLKHRNILERYGLEEFATGLPIGTFDKIPIKVAGVVRQDLPNIKIEEMSREDRINFELQVRDFAETVVGTSLDWSAVHLGRLVDGALQEDILFRMNVAEPPVYTPLEKTDERIVQAIHDKQMLFEEDPGKPLAKTKELLEESYLHREQYRWLFVLARFGGLYTGWERRTGKQSAEKQFLNPKRQEDRQALIDWLNNKDFARNNLTQAGVNPSWITDDVIVRLFKDDNMRKVNDFRKLIFDRESRKVQLSDLRPVMKQVFEESRAGNLSHQEVVSDLAMVLEFVLRHKKTWNVDMGINNSRFSDPNLNLAREVREKSEFGANEAHLLITAENDRKNIHNTYVKILNTMASMHKENEFPDIKEYMKQMFTAFGDDTRYRQGTLSGPELAMETSLSIRAAEMITGYYLAGYEATGGDWVTSQQHLYDRFDMNRILHEHFHPIVGSARRICGIEKHEKWIDDILARQRAVPSNAVDTRWEHDYAISANLQAIIKLETVGGEGKGMYSHCVREIGEYGQDIGSGIKGLHLADDKRYWEIHYERKAQKLYQPGSKMTLAGWRSAAQEGEMNREKARAQIDQYVGLGFMRRWYNNEHKKVGLGDEGMFQAKFETYIDYQHPEKGKGKRMEIFPINFMVSLEKQAYGVSVEWAMAHDYSNPAAFWYEAKGGLWNERITQVEEAINQLNRRDTNYQNNLQQLTEALEQNKEGKKKCDELWQGTEKEMGFREMMLNEWMINVELPDSQIPTYYWEWRDSCLEMLGLTEERAEKLEKDGLYRTYFKLKQKLRAVDTGPIGGENWSQKILRQHGENFRERLETDPVRMALTEVEAAYCKFVVKEVSEEIDRAHGFRGMSAENKVRLREAIVDHYNKGHIDRNTRDTLLSKVIETRYGNGLVATVKDWKNFIVNGGINLSLYDWFFEGGLAIIGLAFKDLKKGFWYDATRAALIPSPLGWTIGIVASKGVGTLVKLASLGDQTNISAVTTILHKVIPFIPETASLPFTWAGILSVWVAAQSWALGVTWLTRGINKYISPRLIGRRWADNDSIIQALEKTKR